MIKQEFIEEIRAPLKKYGFQKKGPIGSKNAMI